MPDRQLVFSGKEITRRDILKAGVLGGLLLPALVSSPASAATRIVFPSGRGATAIAFRNQHTGESFNGVYRVGDRYLPDAFEQINVILRDFRTGEAFPVDPRVIDILFSIRDRIGTNAPFEVLSGYRSPKTNAYLRQVGGGVARNSLHMTGQAIDVRLPGYSTRRLSDVAANLKVGGVGYYKQSDFVHIDTGQVRRWS